MAKRLILGSLLGLLASVCLLVPAAGPGPAAPTKPKPLVIGINVDRNEDFSASRMWTNVKNLLRRWGRLDNPSVEVPGMKLTPDGYPLQDAGALTYLHGYPDGIYTLSFEGGNRDNLIVSGMGQAVSNPVRKNNRWSYKVKIDHSKGEFLYVSAKNINPKNPPRDLRILVPSAVEPAGGAAPPSFTPEYLHRLAPFKVIRFMDLTRTNDTNEREWKDRVKPGDFLQTGERGVAWEYVIELANAAKKDVWINVPDQASDDYVRQLAKLFREKLHPTGTVRVEYSNEMHHTLFPQGRHLIEAAKKNPALLSNEPATRNAQQYAMRVKQISDIFRKEFTGSQANRFLMILGTQAENPYWQAATLEFFQPKYGAPPKKFVKEIALCWYAGNELLGDQDKPGLTLTTLFDRLDRGITTTMVPWLRKQKQMADAYGLPLVAYEGSQGLTGIDYVSGVEMNDALKRQAQGDRRMGKVLTKLLTTWQKEGGGLFMHFSHITPQSKFGSFGLLQSVQEKGSPKWDAVMALALPGGDANLDGKVDMKDFLILKKNFGQKDKWWEEGDFNQDGVVDRADWEILKKHLDLTKLTADEKRQIETFEATLGKKGK